MKFDFKLEKGFSLKNREMLYAGSIRGQWNQTPLVPQDRFSIGGRSTVRGFDGESSLSAERGWTFRNEFSTKTKKDKNIYLGIDHGEVDGPSEIFLPGRRLTGMVVGVKGKIKKADYDLNVGTPLRKPENFETSSAIAQFNLFWQF